MLLAFCETLCVCCPDCLLPTSANILRVRPCVCMCVHVCVSYVGILKNLEKEERGTTMHYDFASCGRVCVCVHVFNAGILKKIEKEERRAAIAAELSKFQPTRTDLYVPTNPDCRVLSHDNNSGRPMQSAAKVSYAR